MRHVLTCGALFTAALFTFSSCNKDDDFDFDFPETGSKAYVTSNTSGMLTIMNTDDELEDVSVKMKRIASMDAEGVYYNKERDEVILASRTTNRLEAYQKKNKNNESLEIKTTSDPNFTNAREIAVSGNLIVVVQDADPALNNNMNRLYVYERTPSGIRYRNTYDVDFNLWGIHADGTTLYAVVDNTSDIVSFSNFFSNPNGMIQPTKRVTVEGIVRTHGITHSKEDNRMVLTDVGDGAVDNDGAIVVINNFSSIYNSAANGGTIGTGSQVRIEGSNTMLGNPVDVAYDNDTEYVYVAERANGGGKVLIFDLPTSNGNPSPAYAKNVAGASAIYLQQ
ncbi:YncE family protein [Pontibacter sp. H249]|uniref:YncE family protein n=1 Tax=Pontibacter sp. H249 TaxID=3133420 RepID=UPI0030BB93A9